MRHDILKRLGLDHLDVSSQDFLDALNRMQREARESLRRAEPLNDPEFSDLDLDLGAGRAESLPPE